MQRSNFILILVVLMLVGSPVHAQFGGKLDGLLGGKTNNATSGSVEQMVGKFVESNGHVIGAQIKFAEAFGLQDQVALLQAEQKALASGATDTDAMKKTKAVSKDAQVAIDARMAEQPELTAESRVTYGEGLVSYIKGLAAARQTAQIAKSAASAFGNPLSLVGNARAGAYVVKEAPDYFKTLQQSSRMAIEYGRRNNIEPPSDATSLLDGM